MEFYHVTLSGGGGKGPSSPSNFASARFGRFIFLATSRTASAHPATFRIRLLDVFRLWSFRRIGRGAMFLGGDCAAGIPHKGVIGGIRHAPLGNRAAGKENSRLEGTPDGNIRQSERPIYDDTSDATVGRSPGTPPNDQRVMGGNKGHNSSKASRPR